MGRLKLFNPKFRQVKILLPNKRWNVRYFTNFKTLYEYLNKTEYYKAYWSISQWLNPRNLRAKSHKKGYQIADKCFLHSDLLFDLDIDSNSTLEDVRKDALEVIRRMEKYKDFKLSFIQFSGSKGLHIVYEQLNHFKAENPIERFKLYQAHRNKLYKEFKDIRTLDSELIKDLYRIFKITNSIDHSTGCKVKELSLKDLNTNHILERLLAYDQDKRQSGLSSQQLNADFRTRIRRSAFFYSWISNTVYGAKDLQVPYLLFNKEQFDKDKLIKLQEEYRLGDLFIFDLDCEIGVLGVKALSKRRLSKVLIKANTLNRRWFLKRNFNKIRTSKIMFEDKSFIDKPKLIDVLKQETDGAYSRVHLDYINKFVDCKKDNTTGVLFNKLMISKIS